MTIPDVELIVVRQAERAGISRRSLARAAQTGELIAVRRGVYVEAAAWGALDGTQQHLLRARALQATMERPPVVSHWTAALLHGLPVPQRELGPICLTVEEGSGRGIAGARARALPLGGFEVLLVDGVLCTTWERTVLDVASAAPYADGVALADAALNALPSKARLEAKVRLAELWRGFPARRATGRVEAVIEFADGDAESPGESMSRVTMHALGLPRPVLQQVFRDWRGFAGKVDFWFPAEGVIGEMDGRSKYVDPRLNRGDPAAVVYDEKRREDRLRAMSRGFARWGWSEACSPTRLGATLAAAGVHACRPSRTASGRL